MQQSAELDRIKDKIRKLLRLGNDPNAFEGEIRNALAAAQMLMDEHHVKEAELAEHGDPSAHPEHMSLSSVYSNSSRMANWEASLAHAIVATIGTIGWFRNDPAIRRSEAGIAILKNGVPEQAVPVCFYGPHEDVELAKELFREMSLTIMAMARLKFGSVFRGEGRSYCEGFARQLSVQADEDSRRRTSACQAIVLRTSQRAELWLRQSQGISLQTYSRRGGYNSHSAAAYAEGRRDGGQTGLSANRRGKLPGNGGALPPPQ